MTTVVDPHPPGLAVDTVSPEEWGRRNDVLGAVALRNHLDLLPVDGAGTRYSVLLSTLAVRTRRALSDLALVPYHDVRMVPRGSDRVWVSVMPLYRLADQEAAP